MKAVAFLLLSVLSLVVSGGVFRSPAEKELHKRLADSRINVGYDRKKDRLVFIGVASASMKDPANDSGFQLKRKHLFRVAEFKGRQELMDYVEKDVTATESLVSYLRGPEARVSLVTSMKTTSSGKLFACTPIASVESFEDGIYSVSVAIGWSDKAERSARTSLKRTDYGDTRKDEIEKWLKGYDFSMVVGARQFVDSAGFVYQVGIAAYDVEGVNALKMKMTMRKAHLTALQELAFSLCAPMLGTKELVQKYGRGSDGMIDGDAVASDLITATYSEIRNMQLPGAGRLFETNVKHPITGKEMYVVVYGLTINDQVVRCVKGTN